MCVPLYARLVRPMQMLQFRFRSDAARTGRRARLVRRLLAVIDDGVPRALEGQSRVAPVAIEELQAATRIQWPGAHRRAFGR